MTWSHSEENNHKKVRAVIHCVNHVITKLESGMEAIMLLGYIKGLIIYAGQKEI